MDQQLTRVGVEGDQPLRVDRRAIRRAQLHLRSMVNLRFPERFSPEIDFEWQKEQLTRERAEEAAACGPDGCALPQR